MAKQFDKWLYKKHGRFMQNYSNISKIIEEIE